MSDYRDPKPIVFTPAKREAKGDGEPLYAEKWPEFAEESGKESSAWWSIVDYPEEDFSNGTA